MVVAKASKYRLYLATIGGLRCVCETHYNILLITRKHDSATVLFIQV